MIMKNEEGMTIIETMVALLVLLIGIIGTISVFTIAVQASQTQANRLSAVHVANQDLSNLTSYETLNWTWPSGLPLQFTTLPPTTVIGNVTYYSSFSYVTCPVNSIEVNLEVTVQVTWKDASGQHSYSETSGLAAPFGASCP
jgi:Tfp pilus assembly protein PilV